MLRFSLSLVSCFVVGLMASSSVAVAQNWNEIADAYVAEAEEAVERADDALNATVASQDIAASQFSTLSDAISVFYLDRQEDSELNATLSEIEYEVSILVSLAYDISTSYGSPSNYYLSLCYNKRQATYDAAWNSKSYYSSECGVASANYVDYIDNDYISGLQDAEAALDAISSTVQDYIDTVSTL